MSEVETKDTKSLNWPRKAMLTRTKPIEPTVTDICQQLTTVVSQQTALTEKLIGAFREAKETGQTNQERLQIPFIDSNRFSPIHESFEDSNKPLINGLRASVVENSSDSSFDSDFMQQIGIRKEILGLESLVSVSSHVDTIKSYNATAANQLRAILTGQTNQESLKNSLSQIYGILNLISIQCGNCKSGLTELDVILNSQNARRDSVQAFQETKSTQTYTSDVDTGDSDPDDKDSGLESNPGRPSESGNSNEEFQLFTEYDELMQAPIPEYSCEEMKRLPSFLKNRKNSCPGELFEKNTKHFTPVCKGIKENEKLESSPERKLDLDSIGNDDTLIPSPKTPEVFSADYNSPDTVQSLPLQEAKETEKRDLPPSFLGKSPKLNKLQRSQTICNYSSSRIFDLDNEEEYFNLNKTQSPMDEKQIESDFANLENQVNIIKFHNSTNTYTSKSRKDSLQSIVFGTRKQISNEVNNIVNKLTPQKRRKADQDTTVIEQMCKTLLERIDQLMQVSQHFGATLHENSHSDEKEILINFIDMVKTLHRPSSIPNSNTVSFSIQRADSHASSGENERRPMSPTSVRYSLKSVESSYQRGFDDGVNYVRGSLEEDIKKNSDYVDKFYRVSDGIKSVLRSEMENRFRFLLGSGAYLLCILAISVILNFLV